MKACDIILVSDLVLTQNPEREVIEDAAVAITGDRVEAVGPAETILARYRPATRKDLGRRLIMPGLVNSHTHTAMTYLRGLADDLPLMEWLNEHIFPVETGLTPEVVEIGTALGVAEMFASGTTGFMDMYLIEEAVARTVDKTGARAVLGEVVFAFPSRTYQDFDGALEVLADLQAKYRDHPLIDTAVMPHAVYTTTPEMLRKCFELATRWDCVFHTHLAETPTETSQCLEQTGMRPVAYLESLGLLSPRTTIAHAVDLDEGEIELLAERGVRACHNPESNMKLASGVSPVPAMIKAGIPVGLGTDGAASNNNLNMFEEMGSAALLQKVRHLDPTLLPASDVLDMATLGSARCLGLEDVGGLEPGKKADLTVVDLESPNMMPMYNPASHLVYAATGGEVRLTMVGGKIVYEDGKFATIDYPALLGEIESLKKWVLKQHDKK